MPKKDNERQGQTKSRRYLDIYHHTTRESRNATSGNRRLQTERQLHHEMKSNGEIMHGDQGHPEETSCRLISCITHLGWGLDDMTASTDRDMVLTKDHKLPSLRDFPGFKSWHPKLRKWSFPLLLSCVVTQDAVWMCVMMRHPIISIGLRSHW